MRKRFIILANHPSPLVLKMGKSAITAYLRDSGMGWWHWFPSVWLVSTSRSEITVQDLCEKIKEIAPLLHHLEFEVTGNPPWTGFSNKKHFAWILEQFGPAQRKSGSSESGV